MFSLYSESYLPELNNWFLGLWGTLSILPHSLAFSRPCWLVSKTYIYVLPIDLCGLCFLWGWIPPLYLKIGGRWLGLCGMERGSRSKNTEEYLSSVIIFSCMKIKAVDDSMVTMKCHTFQYINRLSIRLTWWGPGQYQINSHNDHDLSGTNLVCILLGVLLNLSAEQ